jgi:hypothetical protein
MNIAVATYPRLYVRPLEKHELELVTSTCKMYCNVLLKDCTRHISNAGIKKCSSTWCVHRMANDVIIVARMTMLWNAWFGRV